MKSSSYDVVLMLEKEMKIMKKTFLLLLETWDFSDFDYFHFSCFTVIDRVSKSWTFNHHLAQCTTTFFYTHKTWSHISLKTRATGAAYVRYEKWDENLFWTFLGLVIMKKNHFEQTKCDKNWNGNRNLVWRWWKMSCKRCLKVST